MSLTCNASVNDSVKIGDKTYRLQDCNRDGEIAAKDDLVTVWSGDKYVETLSAGMFFNQIGLSPAIPRKTPALLKLLNYEADLGQIKNVSELFRNAFDMMQSFLSLKTDDAKAAHVFEFMDVGIIPSGYGKTHIGATDNRGNDNRIERLNRLFDVMEPLSLPILTKARQLQEQYEREVKRVRGAVVSDFKKMHDMDFFYSYGLKEDGYTNRVGERDIVPYELRSPGPTDRQTVDSYDFNRIKEYLTNKYPSVRDRVIALNSLMGEFRAKYPTLAGSNRPTAYRQFSELLAQPLLRRKIIVKCDTKKLFSTLLPDGCPYDKGDQKLTFGPILK